MERDPEQHESPTAFPSFIGQDYELWQKYHEEHGKEAYRFRRAYEEAAHQLETLYKFAEENNIDLPGPGPDFT